MGNWWQLNSHEVFNGLFVALATSLVGGGVMWLFRGAVKGFLGNRLDGIGQRIADNTQKLDRLESSTGQIMERLEASILRMDNRLDRLEQTAAVLHAGQSTSERFVAEQFAGIRQELSEGQQQSDRLAAALGERVFRIETAVMSSKSAETHSS